MARFFKRVKTRMLEMQRHRGTVLGGERMEIKASSSKLKGPRGQIVWLTVDRSSSLELGCCRKVRVEEGFSGKEHLEAESADRLSARKWE